MCEGTVTFEGDKLFYFCNVVKYTSTAKNVMVTEVHTYYAKHSID